MFGYDAMPLLVGAAETLTHEEYKELVRKTDDALDERQRRAKQPRVKETIVREREYLNLRLVKEEIAEFTHQPSKARGVYRMVVLCRTIVEERG